MCVCVCVCVITCILAPYNHQHQGTQSEQLTITCRLPFGAILQQSSSPAITTTVCNMTRPTVSGAMAFGGVHQANSKKLYVYPNYL